MMCGIDRRTAKSSIANLSDLHAYSEQRGRGVATVPCFVQSGAPALHEPHFDELGAGADVGGPCGDEFDVAVVSATSEAGDGRVFEPSFVDEGRDSVLVDQLRRPAVDRRLHGPQERGHQGHSDARCIGPARPRRVRMVGHYAVAYAALEHSEGLGDGVLVGTAEVWINDVREASHRSAVPVTALPGCAEEQ